MGNEIELVSDGAGLAVIGEARAVERFLAAENLASKEIRADRLQGLLARGAELAQAGSEISANSGRWVQLTKESAEKVKKFGLMDSGKPGVKHAMIGKPGEVQSWIQIAKTPSSLLTNPAVLSGAAGIMTQMAMQQQMAEIADYLERIDEKLDDVLRAQKNQVLARLDGVGLAVREAMSVRDSVGRVSEVTWSKVQSSSSAILETQGYALRQLADLADKLERHTKLDDIADTTDRAKKEIQQWLAVLARCFELSDAVAVIELDRVLDASPDELDRHRIGLQAARLDRLQLISQSTERLLTRMAAAADMANSKVLLHPAKSPAVVEASNQVALGVGDFHEVLGIEAGTASQDARRWVDAAGEGVDRVREKSAEGLGTVKQFGSDGLGQVRSVKDKLSGRFANRRDRRGEDEAQGTDGAAEDEALR
jgi:hypothetical protein